MSEDQHENPATGPKSITRFPTIPPPIPQREKDGPFDKCIGCGADLLASNHHYVIEKVFRGSEVIIELAMCLNCRSDQSDEGMSESSALRMQEYLQDKIDFRRRLELMSTVNDADSLDPWLERCILSDRPSQMFREYQLVALCRGPWICARFLPGPDFRTFNRGLGRLAFRTDT